MIIARIFLLYLLLLFNKVHCKFFADEVNSVLYDLSISAFPLNEDVKNEHFDPTSSNSATSSAVPTDFVAIGNKYDQKYHCRFPTFAERRPGSDEGLLDPPAAPTVSNDEIREVLDPALKGLCFKNTRDRGGWWTYEFCYKDTIMQYHLENDNKRTGETIYLGRFESEKDWSTPQAMAEVSSKRKKTLYHSHFFTNGTVCDLTNRFRRAEVRFVCYEELPNGAFLHSVDEPESCEYILTIYTAALCRLPAFLPADRKPPPLKIECQPALTAPEYEKYLKAKQAEEVKKAEEAARVKEEEELKKKIEAEKKKYQKPDILKPLETSSIVEPSPAKTEQQQAAKPILHILGRQKADFMKPILAREAAVAAGKSIEEAEKEANELDIGEQLIGTVGTIEYEFLTHWLEQELKDQATDESDEETTAEKDLSELEKYAVNEFKRKTRRVSLLVAFRARLKEMVDDVYFSVIQYDPRVKHLRGQQLKLARQEIEHALTTAVTNMIDELDDTEREMELLDEKTDSSGVAAFERMREMTEERQRLIKELEDSHMEPAEFVKAKLAAMKPLTDEEMEKFDAEGEATAKAELTADPKTKASTEDATKVQGDDADDPTRALKGKKQSQDWLAKDRKKKYSGTKASHRDVGEAGKKLEVASKAEDASSKETAPGSAKLTKGKSFRREMEEQLGDILGDVERELKEEGVFDDLNEDEVTEVKTEAFRSLARTLTNLLEKLDEAERNVETANEQLEETKAPISKKLVRSIPKNSKTTDTEKKLEIWRKLIQGIDEEEQTESNETPQRKPLGKIQVKRGDAAKTKSGDGFRVRVSTIKRKEDETNGDGTGEAKKETKLERRLAEKLKDAGFDTQGRPVQVKIITNFDLDDSDNLLHTLSEEESEQFTNVIYTILGAGSVEQMAEQRRQDSLESSYSFGVDSDSDKTKEKRQSPMKTVTMGGGRP